MFFHIFKYRLLCILRDKGTLFWSAAFPLVLATLFGLALGNVNAGEAFSQIPLAVVENDAFAGDPFLKQALTSAMNGEIPLFAYEECTEDAAFFLLEKGEVSGVMRAEDGENISLFFKKSGIEETIIQSFTDTYLQMRSAYETVIKENPSAYLTLLQGDAFGEIAIENVDAAAKKPDDTAVYYFALIAMACLYSGFQGLYAVSFVQANQSAVAARNNLAPVGKMRFFAAAMSATILVQFLSTCILLAYLKWAIGVSFGARFGLIVLAAFVGTLTGVTFGAVISALLKNREGTKVAVLLSVSMVCSFLAGMMFGNMKYIIQKNVPLLAYLNPANLIADAFYALYYYDTLGRYTCNIALLLAFSVISFLVVYFVARRQKYASL